MIQLLRVMQRGFQYHYVLLHYYYIIFTTGSIFTHYYIFWSPELADGVTAGEINLRP